MVELEKSVISRLADKLTLWFRYVDDTFTFINKDDIDYVTHALNSYHNIIKFTNVKENNNKLAFLDVLVERNYNGSLNTSVYRKESDTKIYINWEAYAPKEWKIGTLKGLFRRAFLVSSSEESLNREISHLKYVFKNINCYPSGIIHKTLFDVRKMLERENALNNPVMTTDTDNDNLSEQTSEAQEIIP